MERIWEVLVEAKLVHIVCILHRKLIINTQIKSKQTKEKLDKSWSMFEKLKEYCRKVRLTRLSGAHLETDWCYQRSLLYLSS